ncbi:hypothetical protein BDP27DRAFT_1378459, partial [Rhodocollybia butyracea]
LEQQEDPPPTSSQYSNRLCTQSLRETIPCTQEECYQWVPIEFEGTAQNAYVNLNSPILNHTTGWKVRTISLYLRSGKAIQIAREEVEPIILRSHVTTYPFFAIQDCIQFFNGVLDGDSSSIIATYKPSSREWQHHDVTTKRRWPLSYSYNEITAGMRQYGTLQDARYSPGKSFHMAFPHSPNAKTIFRRHYQVFISAEQTHCSWNGTWDSFVENQKKVHSPAVQNVGGWRFEDLTSQNMDGWGTADLATQNMDEWSNEDLAFLDSFIE